MTTTNAIVSVLDDGKFEVVWPIVTVMKDSHYLTGRPETVRALMDDAVTVVSHSEVHRVYANREEADRQL